MFGQRTVFHRVAEQAGVLFPSHEEGLVVRRNRNNLTVFNTGFNKVADVIVDPAGAVPFNQHLLGVPRFAVHVGRRTVVEDSTVGRPREGEFAVKAQSGWISQRAAGAGLSHSIPFLVFVVEVAAVNPHAAGCVAVGCEFAVALQQFAGLGVVAVNGVSNCLDIELTLRIAVIPVDFGNLVRIDAAFLTIQLSDTVEETSHDFEVALSLSCRFNGFLTPLQPAAGVGDRTFFFVNQGCRQHVDGCLNFFRLHARSFPEGSSFSCEPVSNDHPVKLAENFAAVLGVRFGMSRVHTPNQVTLDLVFCHVMESRDRGVVVLQGAFRQKVIAVVVFCCGVVAIPFFQHGNHELRLVHVVAVGIGFFRKVGIQCRMVLLDRPSEVARSVVHGGADVGRALNVRFAAEGVNTAACNTDVA